jgi:hypothetical protein
VSERSRRSNAPSVSVPEGYSAEPGSAESVSQRSSVGSELLFDPYSAQAQAGPKKRKSIDIMELEGDDVQKALSDMFGFLPIVNDLAIPLSQNIVLLRDINNNTDEIEKFIKNNLNSKKELKNKKLIEIKKIVDQLSGTFTRFLNNEPLSKINDKKLLDIYNESPDTVDGPFLKKKQLYTKMKENTTNYNDIETVANASAAAGKKRISKKQVYNILKNKTTKSTSTIKQLDSDILKILNS